MMGINGEELGLYAEEKFTDANIVKAVRIIKAITEDDPEIYSEIIVNLKQAKENFVYNADAVLKGLEAEDGK